MKKLLLIMFLRFSSAILLNFSFKLKDLMSIPKRMSAFKSTNPIVENEKLGLWKRLG